TPETIVRMPGHTLKRLLYTIPVVWLMLSAIFILSSLLPGRFGEEQLLQTEIGFYGRSSQSERTAAYQQLQERTQQHLPLFYVSLEPLSVEQMHRYTFLLPSLNWHGTQNQYHRWLSGLLRGSMGESYATARPVTALIREAAAATSWILLMSMTVTVLLALWAGKSLVHGLGRKRRKFLLAALVILDSLPLFVLALLLLLLLANPDTMQLFPVFGLGYTSSYGQSTWQALLSTFPYLVLPALCLVLTNLPYLTNQFYSSLKGTMQADYIKTARAKGLSPTSVITKHALRNALLPVITILSDMLPAMVAGTVVIETIFAIPGVGRLLVSSVLARDFPVIVGIVVVIALVKMVSHVVADVAYSLADPRIRRNSL
ncbi:MAG TPA: ABC transporter permease, partial [Pontibacter sp.]